MTKESLISPTFLVLKVPLEVLHDSGAALFTMGRVMLVVPLLNSSIRYFSFTMNSSVIVGE